MKISVVKASYI